MKSVNTLSVCLCVAGLAAAASGTIISTAGMVTQIPAPGNAFPGSLTAFNAWAWNEQSQVPLAAMPVDMITNPSNTSAPVAGNLTALVDSHFIHFDGIPGTTISGSVTFATPIIGVQYRDLWLDFSDPLVTPGTVYPTGFVMRGWSNTTGADFLDVNGNVLQFNMSATGQPDFEQVRVFTVATPAPGSLALLGLGGLAAIRRRKR